MADTPDQDTREDKERRANGCLLLFVGFGLMFCAVDLASIAVLGRQASVTFTKVGDSPVESSSGSDAWIAWGAIILIGSAGLALALWGDRKRGRKK
jgi:hypothetical protein